MMTMPRLTKYSVPEISAELEKPFSITNIAYVDDLLVSVYACEGELHWDKHVDFDELFWVYDGRMTLESERGDVTPLPAGTLLFGVPA